MAKGATKKSAKGRLDKYYKLAKEQGYRARSAFKLIQLNRKYEFLNSAKFCIDLCAAPGGWLQVASKHMPPGSLIIGCDLDVIKPIPRVITFPCDITTPQCRQLIRSHAKDWLADVILHDGAPNVGKSWVQDAFTQSELVLSSLKLAVEFLKKGGTFITKVFRSKDYNNLMWVFSQLFGKVEATKPPSSRNVSAEIFVVCLNFHAPAHIDPKFLDPKHVFKDIESLPPAPILDDATSVKTDSKSTTTTTPNKLTPNAISIFKPGKKVRNRGGYDDNATTLFKAGTASQLVLSNAMAAIAFLGDVNRIDFVSEEEKRWFGLKVTDDDIKANCADLKVLGKRDFQKLLKWRAAIREEIGLEVKKNDVEEFTEEAEVVPLDPEQEEEQIQQELEKLTGEEAARRKRERRRTNEKKQKGILRMQLRMTAPTDIGMESQDLVLKGQGADDFFDINEAEGKKAGTAGDDSLMAAYDDGAWSTEDEHESEVELEYLDSDEEKEARLQHLEGEIDGMYEAYVQKMMEKDAKYRVRQNRAKDKAKSEIWEGIEEKKDSDDESEVGGTERHLGWENMLKDRAKIGESSDEEGSDASPKHSDDDDDEDLSPRPKKRRRTSPSIPTSQEPTRLVQTFDHLVSKPSGSKSAQVWFGQDVFKGLGDLDDLSDDESEETKVAAPPPKSAAGPSKEQDSMSDVEDDDFEEVPLEEDTTMWDVDDENIDEKKAEQVEKYGLLTAEAVTMAQRLVNRQTTKTHLINDGFTRYSLNEKDGLPAWFIGEERNYYGLSLPITKESVRILREKQRALDARPIKKVAEAKARKKMRMVKRLQKAAQKAEGLTENGDMNEKQKSEAMAKIMKKGKTKDASKGPVKLIVARGVYKGSQGQLKGVKGRYRVVDPRQKKDLRGEKRAAKLKKKRKH